MRTNANSIYSAAELVLDPDELEILSKMLFDTDSSFVATSDSYESMRDMLARNRARLMNSATTGKTLYGFEKLIRRGEQFPSGSMVRGASFESSEVAGSVYWDDESDRIVGLAAVRRN